MPSLRQYKNIVAFQTGPDRFLGFHSLNLEIAELDQEAWNNIENPIPGSTVLDELDAWSTEAAPDVTDSTAPRVRNSLTLNIAEICNLDCGYCGAGGDGSFSKKGAKKVDVGLAQRQIAMALKPMRSGEVFELRFIGGEPTLYPGAIKDIFNYVQLYNAGSGVEVRYGITTNGTLITPKVAELLAEMNATVAISIDGATETNDRIRPTKSGRGSTALTLRGISELQKVRDRLRGLIFNCTFSSQNTAVVEAYKFLKKFNPDRYSIGFASSRGDEMAVLQFNEQFRKLADLIYKESGIEGLTQVTSIAKVIHGVAAQVRRKLACGNGGGNLYVDTSGRYYTCLWAINSPEKAVGQDRQIEQKTLDAWMPAIDQKQNKCHTCWARYLCGGECESSNFAKNGDSSIKDKSHCSIAMNIIEVSLKYYAQHFTTDSESQGDHNETH